MPRERRLAARPGGPLILVPTLLALLLFVALPQMGSVLVAPLGFPAGLGQVVGFAAITALGVAVLWLTTRTAAEPEIEDDDPIATGTLRGQDWFLVVAGLCAAVLGLAFAWAGGDVVRGALAAAGVGLLAVDWPIRREKRSPGLGLLPTIPERLEDAGRVGAAGEDDTSLGPGDAVEKTWTWAFTPNNAAPGTAAGTHSLALKVSKRRYEAFKARPRVPRATGSGWGEFGKYVSGGRTPEVRRCAALLVEKSRALGLRFLDHVEFVLAFLCQAFPYGRDPDIHGVPDRATYPIELLWLGTGDCEDHAILAAALFAEMEMDVVLFWLDLGDEAHVAVGIHADLVTPSEGHRWLKHDGKTYFYCEATPSGPWRFGEIPEDFARRLKGLYAVPVSDAVHG